MCAVIVVSDRENEGKRCGTKNKVDFTQRGTEGNREREREREWLVVISGWNMPTLDMLHILYFISKLSFYIQCNDVSSITSLSHSFPLLFCPPHLLQPASHARARRIVLVLLFPLQQQSRRFGQSNQAAATATAKRLSLSCSRIQNQGSRGRGFNWCR